MKLKLCSVFGLLAVACAWMAGSRALAEPVGTRFTYQGRFEQAGQPFTGVVDIGFILFDAEIGGNEIADAVFLDTSIADGRIEESMDFGQFGAEARWIEVQVRFPAGEGNPIVTLAPRQRLNATPLANFALKADSAMTAQTAAIADNAGPRGIAVFSSFGPPGTQWVVPANVNRIAVELWGGGGGGGGSSFLSGGGCEANGYGGGSGGYVRAVIDVVPGETLTILVGAGGAGGTLPPQNGQNGGDTKVVRSNNFVLANARGGHGATSGSPGLGGAGGAGGLAELGTPLVNGGGILFNGTSGPSGVASGNNPVSEAQPPFAGRLPGVFRFAVGGQGGGYCGQGPQAGNGFSGYAIISW